MRTRTVAPTVGAALFLGLALAAPCGGADQPAKDAGLPFRDFTAVWHGKFEVGTPALDRDSGQLTWPLLAKQETSLGRYEAFLADPDGVEVATLPVQLTPNRSPVKAGSRLQAVVPLKGVNVDHVSRVVIRERR